MEYPFTPYQLSEFIKLFQRAGMVVHIDDPRADRGDQEKNRIRNDALEEAARLVERYCDSPMNVQIVGAEAAKAIRALKVW